MFLFKVVRIQNPPMYKQYCIHKEDVTRKLEKTTIVVEQTLWHGTSKENVSKISRSFFDRGLAGSNGRLIFFYR